jgi:hypothetical protein
MPFQVKYRTEWDQEVVIRNVTKVEGVWMGSGGALSHYCFYTGNRPTEHRKAAMVPINQVLSMNAHLLQPREVGA